MFSYNRAQWTADQHAYERALRDGPTAALERFRTAYFARPPGHISKDDESSQLSDVLSDCLSYTNTNNEGLWCACADDEFILFLLDVMAEPAFLYHFPGFSADICSQVVSLIAAWRGAVPGRTFDDAELRRLQPSSLVEMFWVKLAIVWESLWNHRDFLAKKHAPDSNRLLERLDVLAFSIRDFKKKTAPGGAGSKKMAQFAYYAWAHLHGADGTTENDTPTFHSFHHALAVLEDHLVISDAFQNRDILFGFLRELINDVGINCTLRANYNVLAASPLMYSVSLLSCLKMLLLQMAAIGEQFYSSVPILLAIAKALARQQTQGELFPQNPHQRMITNLNVARVACEHINAVVKQALTGHVSAIALSAESAQSVWSIFICTSSAILSAEKLLLVQGHNNVQSSQLRTTLSELLSSAVDTMGRLTTAVRQRRLPSDVINDLHYEGLSRRDTGSGTWYSIVPIFREGERLSLSPATLATFLDAWISLGNALGLDEIVERDRLAAYRAHICCWRACAFHTTPCPDPLSVCKGCHENRYCSKACQTQDWKEGGHRAQCRRLKK